MRCLLVRSGFLGDIVLSTSAVAAMKRKHPSAEITYACWARCAEIIALNPHINEIVKPGDYMTSDFSHRVDFRHESLMTDYPETYWGQLHAMNAANQGLLDISTIESFKPQLFIGPNDVAKKVGEKPLVVLNTWSMTGTGWRLWDFDKWVKLVVILKAMGYKTVQIGGKDDPPVDGVDTQLCGQTRLAQIPGILAVADLFIGIDSFCSHVSHSTKYINFVEEGKIEKIGDSTPTVLLAGPIPPECVVPTDARCVVASYYPDSCGGPCNHSFATKELPICEFQNECMRGLSVEKVLSAIEEVKDKWNS